MWSKREIVASKLYGNALAAVQKSTDAPNTFSEFLNTNHPSIKFTMEMKQIEHVAIPRLWTKMCCLGKFERFLSLQHLCLWINIYIYFFTLDLTIISGTV